MRPASTYSPRPPSSLVGSFRQRAAAAAAAPRRAAPLAAAAGRRRLHAHPGRQRRVEEGPAEAPGRETACQRVRLFPAAHGLSSASPVTHTITTTNTGAATYPFSFSSGRTARSSISIWQASKTLHWQWQGGRGPGQRCAVASDPRPKKPEPPTWRCTWAAPGSTSRPAPPWLLSAAWGPFSSAW